MRGVGLVCGGRRESRAQRGDVMVTGHLDMWMLLPFSGVGIALLYTMCKGTWEGYGHVVGFDQEGMGLISCVLCKGRASRLLNLPKYSHRACTIHKPERLWSRIRSVLFIYLFYFFSPCGFPFVQGFFHWGSLARIRAGKTVF